MIYKFQSHQKIAQDVTTKVIMLFYHMLLELLVSIELGLTCHSQNSHCMTHNIIHLHGCVPFYS